MPPTKGTDGVWLKDIDRSYDMHINIFMSEIDSSWNLISSNKFGNHFHQEEPTDTSLLISFHPRLRINQVGELDHGFPLQSFTHNYTFGYDCFFLLFLFAPIFCQQDIVVSSIKGHDVICQVREKCIISLDSTQLAVTDALCW